MTREVSLKLVYGDTVAVLLEQDHEHAVATAYVHVIDCFSDETDVFGLPEPVTEDDLNNDIASRGLDQRFGFEIISPPIVPDKPREGGVSSA